MPLYLIGPQTKARLDRELETAQNAPLATRLSDAEIPPWITIKTPSGGIPPATISGDTVTHGVATCVLVSNYWDGSTPKGKITEVEVKVCNNFLVPISGNAVIQAKHDREAGMFLVDTDSCEA